MGDLRESLGCCSRAEGAHQGVPAPVGLQGWSCRFHPCCDTRGAHTAQTLPASASARNRAQLSKYHHHMQLLIGSASSFAVCRALPGKVQCLGGCSSSPSSGGLAAAGTRGMKDPHDPEMLHPAAPSIPTPPVLSQRAIPASSSAAPNVPVCSGCFPKHQLKGEVQRQLEQTHFKGSGKYLQP